MIRRVFLSLFVIAAVGDFFAVPMARATDVFWDGGAGTTVWATNNNWNPNFFPEAQFSERAILGTDDPAPGQLSANAVIAVTPATVGGIALGLRERSSGVLVNPAPAAGALLGTLTISAGNVDSRTTGQASTGADGRVLVGVEGRGYLTMTGGRLRATQLRVAGEQVTTGAGLSTVDLSGNAEINISNAQNLLAQQANDAAVNTATFSRNLKITGPNVVFNSFGRLTLEATNAYTANITSATLHSTLRTSNIAVVSGSLAVNFSGAGATGHAFGETWDLVDSPLAIAGNFSGLGTNNEIAVTGLAAPAPIGTAYRIKKVSDGTGQTLQLAYDRYLVLRANRNTGELTITNPHGGPIQIDGYTVNSSLGSLLTSYSGISGQGSPPDAGWFKPVDGSSQPLNTVNALTEIKSAIFSPPSNPTFNVTGIPSFTIGTGFSKTAVADDVANFGTDGEDLTFSYSTPEGLIVGHVEYVGTKFENNMVLLVDPDNGQAFLKNDSMETLAFDGYTITSSTASLDGSGWTGLSAGAGWVKSLPTTTTSLSQTNAAGSSTLAPGAQLALGDIGTFASASAQAGLSLKFILSEGLEGTGSLDGDFDTDGDVDGRDFLVWQRGGSPSPFGATDLANWQANYGMSGGGAAPPETSFRNGSVVFDSAASLAAFTAVPEPTTGLMMLCVVVGVALLGRQREYRLCEQAVCIEPVRELGYQRGERNMSMRFGWCVMTVAVMFAVLFVAESASAVTQGFPLTNDDFELPGPAGSKTVAFGETGIPFAPTDPVVILSSGVSAGGIPGWTFTGGNGGVGEELCVGLGCETFGDLLPGDSGTEGKGTLPGNEMILSTNDGKAYQTSATILPGLLFPATQKLLLTFDVHNIFTPVGQGQLTAWIHYVDGGGTRQVLGSPVVTSPLGGYQTVTLEFLAGNAALTPALGRPLGVTFDTTSREFDVTAVQSWAGIDDVILEIAGVLPGDFNGDGAVTLADYTILNNNLEEAHDFLADGDILRDGFVDLNDFRAWKSLPSVISSGVLAQIAAIPEPSSAVLVLIGTALFGSFSRRRLGVLKMNHSLLLAVVAGVGLLSMADSASAAVLYYDPILTGSNPAAGEYAVGTLGTTVGPGQNPIVGSFFTGPWQIGATDATLGGTSAQATGLSFLGSPAAGGSLIANGSSRAFRTLTTPFSATTVGSYYISFLANFGGVGVDPNSTDANAVGHRNIELEQIAGNEGSNFRVGYSTYNGNFSNRIPSQAPLIAGPFGGEVILEGGPASFAADNGATHLIVFKFTMSDLDLSDSVEIFLDPNENEEPVIANAAFFARNITLERISGPVQFGGAGTSAQFDELRVADTYEDALPDFPRKGNTNPGTGPGQDDLVDILDYTAITQHMNLTGQSTTNGDVTGDGKVDLLDLRVWRDNRTDIPGLGAVGSVTVPEPTSVALALLASLGVLGFRRR